MHATFESAPKPKYFDQAITNIKTDDVFRSITQLCASSGWVKDNIGTKFLQLVRYVMRLDTTAGREDKKHILKYEILSITIQRILGILEDKLKDLNANKELTVDEQILLCHVATTCNVLVT